MTTIIISDTLQKEVEKASAGKCTVIRTPKGNPSYMTRIPKFSCEEVSDDLGTGLHPAFISGGKEIGDLFIGTYPAVIIDGEALSLPYQVPHRNINLCEARKSCAAADCHLMTNWESAALALLCIKNNFIPRGNTDYGKSHSHPDERGVLCGEEGITLTGSGPATWRHDGTLYGVDDLAGNIFEWRDGLLLDGGQIIMPVDNDWNTPDSEWPNIEAFLNGVNGIQISNSITKRGWINSTFRNMAVKNGFDIPIILKQSLLYPCKAMLNIDPNITMDYMWVDNNKRFKSAALRGGGFDNEGDAGVFYLFLSTAPSSSGSLVGFRACKAL